MPRDCYKNVYVVVYKQGLADGLTDVAATNAAKSAMEDCFAQQRTKPPITTQYVPVPGGILPDPGPVTDGQTNADRGTKFGTRKKTVN